MSVALTSAENRTSQSHAILYAQRDGVLLIGHGTRDVVGAQQFSALAKLLSVQLAPVAVEACLLELQQPTIAEAWQRLRERGVTRVLVSPLLLFSAGHAKTDIPDAIDRSAAQTPEMCWLEARPLSRAPELLQLVLKRLDESLALADAAIDQTAVVLVGRGSFDPCAQADMKLLTHWVAGQRNAAIVTTSFYAMAHPKLITVMRRVASAKSIRSIIIQPHLLFEGTLYQAIVTQVRQVADEFPDKQFIVSNYLGPEHEIVEAIVRRLSQTCDHNSNLAPTALSHESRIDLISESASA